MAATRSSNRLRGRAVEHSFNSPIELSETGRLRSLSNAQEELIVYATKISGPILCGIVLFISVSFSLAMTTMGCLYLYECPAREYIPVYLIVEGTMSLVYVIGRSATATMGSKAGYFTLLSVFLAVWFIVGSVWIFTLYEPNYDVSAGRRYCHRNLYEFSFWITIVEYIMVVIAIIYLCVLCVLQIPVDINV